MNKPIDRRAFLASSAGAALAAATPALAQASEDARLRAELTFAAGIGLLHLTSSAEQAQSVAQRERFLALMLGEAGMAGSDHGDR